MKFAILITEADTVCVIEGTPSEAEIKKLFLDANLKTLYDHLAKCIFQAKLSKPHYYRFKIQVHAEEI